MFVQPLRNVEKEYILAVLDSMAETRHAPPSSSASARRHCTGSSGSTVLWGRGIAPTC